MSMPYNYIQKEETHNYKTLVLLVKQNLGFKVLEVLTHTV